MSHETSGALEEAASHTLAASAVHDNIEGGTQERPENAVSVMVVDDEPGVRGFVAKVLTRHGYSCYEAGNASEAIARATTAPPSLTITVIRMPGSDDSWLLGQLKKRYPEMAVIMLTAVPEAKTAVECLKADADDYLVKPIDMEALVRATDRALEKRLYRELMERKDVCAVRLWARTEGELRLAVDEGSFGTDGREAAESAFSDARHHGHVAGAWLPGRRRREWPRGGQHVIATTLRYRLHGLSDAGARWVRSHGIHSGRGRLSAAHPHRRDDRERPPGRP